MNGLWRVDDAERGMPDTAGVCLVLIRRELSETQASRVGVMKNNEGGWCRFEKVARCRTAKGKGAGWPAQSAAGEPCCGARRPRPDGCLGRVEMDSEPPGARTSKR